MCNDPKITEIVCNNWLFNIQKTGEAQRSSTKPNACNMLKQFYLYMTFLGEVFKVCLSRYTVRFSIFIKLPLYIISVRHHWATCCIQSQILQNAENQKRFFSRFRRNQGKLGSVLLFVFFPCKDMLSPARLKWKLPDGEY